MPDYVLASYGLLWLAASVFLSLTAAEPSYFLFTAGSLLINCGALLRHNQITALCVSTTVNVRRQRMLHAVVIIQGVSIATAALILWLLHQPEYVVPALAAVTGLHLLPLAPYGSSTDKLTSGALVLWSAASIALITRGHVAVVSALGAGVIMFAGLALRKAEQSRADVAPGR